MSVSIRLKKMGKKDQPFYRLVVADTLKKREGSYIENLGWYNPLAEGDNFKIDQERVEYWLSNGARISHTAKNILSKARKGGGAATADLPPAPVPEAAQVPTDTAPPKGAEEQVAGAEPKETEAKAEAPAAEAPAAEGESAGSGEETEKPSAS